MGGEGGAGGEEEPLSSSEAHCNITKQREYDERNNEIEVIKRKESCAPINSRKRRRTEQCVRNRGKSSQIGICRR